MKEKVKIGFLSIYDINDRKSSSGTCFKMAHSLKLLGEVEWIPIKIPVIFLILDRVTTLVAKLCKRKIIFGYTSLGARLLVRNVEVAKMLNYDVIIAFFCGNILAYMNVPSVPILYFSDATFPAMIDYYPEFTKLLKWNISQAINIERRSLDKADSLIFPSNWSAESAIKDLGQSANKIHVIEFGANIDEEDIAPKSISDDEYLHILFLGVNWFRKGGDIALEAVRWLNQNGIKAILHIVGIKHLQEKIKSLPYVDHVGFLNKNNSSEYFILVKTIAKCNLLLLPTIAECAGIAFAEASANGLPIFTHDTGGVSNYVKNGVNGYMLPLGSSGEQFGEKIKECIENNELSKLSLQAHDLYLKKLNWRIWAERVGKVIRILAR